MTDDGKRQSYHGNHNINLQHMLRRLHRNTKMNIPSLMAHRTSSTFSLHPEPPPKESNRTVFVMVYPQNPFVSEPDVRRMVAADIQPGLINTRVQMQGDEGIFVQPDDEGHYLYWEDEPEFNYVNVFYYVTLTLQVFERYANRTISWAFPYPRILVDPNVGELANAFYDENARLLGFHEFPDATSKNYDGTAQSADIIAHETAHAVLDGLRDLYNESFGLGTRSFHESFGDISSILVALHDDSLIRWVLQRTNNNLHTTNFLTEVGEHLANNLKDAEHITNHTRYLRNAFNQLKNVPFEQLPTSSDDPTVLTRQEHNYSRLFSGAFYDILVGIYEMFSKGDGDGTKGNPPFVALYRARDVVGHLLVFAIEVAPVGEMDFSDMARAFLTADNILYDGMSRGVIETVFDERRILTKDEATAHLAYLDSLPDIRLPQTLNKAMDAALFLENEILPNLDIKPNGSDDLVPFSTYRNANGHAFLTFFSTRTIGLDEIGDDYRGAAVDLFGGLTLMFDANDKLRSAYYRPVTDTDIAQIKVIVGDWVAGQRIVDDVYPPELAMRPFPEGLHLSHERLPDETSKLVKYPTIYDDFSQERMRLVDYLKSWQSPSNT